MGTRTIENGENFHRQNRPKSNFAEMKFQVPISKLKKAFDVAHQISVEHLQILALQAPGATVVEESK